MCISVQLEKGEKKKRKSGKMAAMARKSPSRASFFFPLLLGAVSPADS